MQDLSDQRVSASVAANAPVFRTVVDLEIRSTFAFQGSRWLGDIAPQLLDEATRAAIVTSKERASKRVQIEKLVPKHLLYTKGWPTVMPTEAEAELLCAVRRDVAALLDIEIGYTTPAAVLERYADLMTQNAAKEAAKAKKSARKRLKTPPKETKPAHERIADVGTEA